MKIDNHCDGHYNLLPEDVRAVLNLFSDNYALDMWMAGSGRGFFDIFDESTDKYVFSQDILPVEINARRFSSWVRAGMPEGYIGGNTWEGEE